MTKNQIVIVTQMEDAHADDVILRLGEMGHEPVRLNTQDIPSNIRLTMSFGRGAGTVWSGAIEILTNGRAIAIDQVRSVWWRRPGRFGLPDGLSEQESEFATGEIDHTLRGLWASLDCYWMSPPDRIRQASWRAGQLRRAAEIGFDVPQTLITTDLDEVRRFHKTFDGHVVYKVMSDPFLGLPKIEERYPDRPLAEVQLTRTTLITETELAMLDSIAAAPCMFQEYVPKRVELRVTVIGDEVFPAEIHSQEREETLVDWHGSMDIRYSKADLPPAVAERCLALVRSYGLNFSAIDLIVTPDDRYVFVESNPNGQFAFVEELVPELEMTAAIADCLVRGGNG